jgi:hypothetical protein
MSEGTASSRRGLMEKSASGWFFMANRTLSARTARTTVPLAAGQGEKKWWNK